MSEDDSELQRLQAKRLAEMQKNISSRDDSVETPEPSKEKTVNPRDILIKQLGFRGLEVLTNAESQFPNETKMIIDKLYELIKNGEITEKDFKDVVIEAGFKFEGIKTVSKPLNNLQETEMFIEKNPGILILKTF